MPNEPDNITPEHLKHRDTDPEGKKIAEQIAKRLKSIKAKYLAQRHRHGSSDLSEP